jgi:hypothetical protein
MVSLKLTYVFGNPATGKSTLLRLLDGHSNLAVSPVQEYLIGAFTSYDPNENIVDDANNDVFDILQFRRRLAHTGYYKLEAVQTGSPRSGVGASRKSSVYRQLDGFDFYDFERDWMSRINDDKTFNSNDVLMKIFHSLFSQWDDYRYNEHECKRVIGSGGWTKTNLKYVLESVPNSNIIILQRDPRGIVATRGKVGSYDINKLLSGGKIFDYIEFDNFIENMKAKHKNKIHIVNFRDLIYNAREELQDVVEFLDIPWEEVLKYPTFAGVRLEEDYLGLINDDWKNILNGYEKNVAELQMGENKKSDASVKELITYARSKLYHNSRPYHHLGKKGFEKFREMI